MALQVFNICGATFKYRNTLHACHTTYSKIKRGNRWTVDTPQLTNQVEAGGA